MVSRVATVAFQGVEAHHIDVQIQIMMGSVAFTIVGLLAGGELVNRRPFRAPHHSASMAALIGGGCHFLK